MSVSSIKLSVAGLLLLGVALIFVSGDAEAIDPEWSYETGDNVRSVAVSADGEYIVAGSDDNKVYLFDKNSSTPLWSYTADGSIVTVAISADGEYIVAGSGDDKVYLFDKDSSTPLWSYTTGGYDVYSVAISADGEYIAAGSEDYKVYLFDKDSSTPLWSYTTGHDVSSIAISADGEYIAAGSRDYKVYLFDKDSSTPLWSYSTGSEVPSVAISADGEYITAGSWDNKVYLFDKDSSTPLWFYYTGNVVVVSVDISADGQYIVAGSGDDRVYLFDKGSSGPLWNYETNDDVQSVAISADGEYIAVGSEDDKVYLFDKDSSTPLWSYTTGDWVNTVAISADGKYVATGSQDDSVYAFKNSLAERPSVIPYGPRSGSENVTNPILRWFAGSDDRSNLTFDVYLDTNSNPTTLVANDTSNLSYVTSDLALGTKYYWKVVASDPSGSITSSVMNFTVEVAPEWTFGTDDEYVRMVDISQDGEYIVIGSNDDYVYLFDKDSSTPLWSYDAGNNVCSVAISADGEYIAAGTDTDFYLFDKDSSTPLWSYDAGGCSNEKTLAISEDGEFIVFGSDNGSIYLWGKDSSTPLWSYHVGNGVESLSISADGSHIVAGTRAGDPVIFFFDRESSTPRWTHDIGGDEDVVDIAISADGNYVIAGVEASGNQPELYFYGKNSSIPLWTYETGAIVYSVSISANGDYIVVGTGDDDKGVYLFGKDSSTPLWTYEAESLVYSVSISADGKYIIGGGPGCGDECVDRVYFFKKGSSNPVWTYSEDEDEVANNVAISSEGRYVVVSYYDRSRIELFQNNLVDRPSLIPYGPRNGSDIHTNPQLGWFAGSDDRSNLTFDVYLDTDSDPDTKVADDITTFYYNLQCLDIDTKYYWKVVATDGDGSVTSSVMNFTTTSYGNIFCISIDDDYDPAELTIIKGATVIWTNDDSSLHTVTEDDDEFDSGSISPGNTWSYTFDTVGTYDYYDQYDDYDGQIIVLTSYPPVASIDSISPQIAELDSSVSFSGSGSDGDGTISEYKWISSIDGDLSSSASFSITDLSFGNHTITFSVKDNDGVWSDDATSWVDVRKSPEWSFDTEGEVNYVAISADGEYIAAGHDDKVHLFDKDDSTPLWSYETGDNVYPVAISADGEYIVAGSRYDGDKVYLFDKDSSTPLWSYSTGGNVRSVAISADGEHIAAGSQDDNKVYLFDKDSNTPLWSYETGDNVNSVAISADGEYIVAGSWDYKVYLFDKDSSTPLWSYTTGDRVESVAISADGEYIVAGSWDYKVYLFDKDSGMPLWSYTTGHYVYSVAISADGEYTTAGSYDGNVYFFDKDSSTPLWSYTTGDDVYSVAISANGEYIVVGSLDHKVYLFDKDSNTPLWSYTTGHYVHSVAISADGEYIASTSTADNKVYTFRNYPVSRPSVIPYGPRSNSTTLNDTTLGWFPGSDDIANLTFDVYMSFIYNDVANNNSAALIADDISNYTHLVTGLTESKKYYWKVVATDPTGSATSRIMNFTVGDYTAPVTDITSGPSDPSDYTNATFYFEADEDNVDFKCKMDTGSWSYCSSPKTYTDLSRGTYHQFKVKATDPSGNEGEPDTWIWEILDNDIPELTNYNVSPSPAEPGQRVYFYSNFSDSDGYIIDYSWISDSDGLLSSSGNFSTDDLSAGSHSIRLRARDNDGDWSDNTTFDLNIEEDEENNPPELTNYNVSPNPADYGDRVYFYTNFSDSDGYITDYSWISDSDGLLSSSGNFSIDVLSVGYHSIVLRARDNDGAWSDNTTFDLNIEDGEEESDDPVAYWKFDEGSGDISYDSSGNGFNGILQNNPEWVDGISGGALEFVGDANVEISNFSIPRSEGTITVWFQIHNWSTDKHARHFFSDNATDRSDSTVRHAFSLQSNGSLRIFEYEGISFSSSPLTWEDDQWYHLSFIWEASGRSIMRDGQIVATTTQNGSFSKDGIDLMIGNSIYDLYHNPGTGIGAAEGVLDEVSIWNRALSSEEILEWYDSYEIPADNQIPMVGGISITPNPAYSNERVYFTGENSSDSDGYVVQFEWMSDIDGFLSNGNEFSTVELSIGNHTISFRVKDDEGAWSNYTYESLIINQFEETVEGCMDTNATNYDSNATVGDGSCEYIETGLPWSYETGNFVYSVDISADGEYIVAGASFDANVYFFNKDSNIPLWTYETGGSVNTVSISSNGEYIVAGSSDKKVYVFHKNSSIPLWTYETEELLQYYSVSISADGERIVVGSIDNKIYLFDKDSNIPLWIYETGNDIWSVDISEDGNYLVAGSLDSKVYLFSEGDSNPLWTYSTGSGVRSVSISQNGDYIIAGSGNSVYCFSKESSIPVWNYETGGIIWGVSVSASGEHIAVSSYDYNVYFFHRDSGTPIWQYATGAPQLPTVDISSDGKYIVAGSYDGEIYLFDKDSSNPIMINGTGGMVFSVSISADGQYFTGGSSDSHVYAFRNMDWDGTNTTTDVYGCTNSTANNYNSEATVDDGSCVFEELEDTSNVTSNYYFSPLEEFALTTSYDDLSTTQNYSISVQAQYDAYSGIRTNRQPVSVGTWSIGPLSSDATISIEFAEMWWEDTEGQDDTCEWTFYIYHNGGLVNDKVVSCGSNGDDLVREVYNISTSLEVNVGDMVDINIWYEGWDDVEIFYGSQSVPTGFYISGLEIEDECSFDTFMDNIYVQSPSISGPVIDEYMLLEVGKGSYHFVSEDNVYISWETTDLSGIKLDNGQPLPSKKSFTETTFDYENRIFTGKIDFALEGGTYGGAASWDYQMIFSEDYTSIIGGQIYRIDSGDKIFYTWTFGDDGNYPYYALCTLTAADYYSENPFEDPTSPDEQVTTPEDGGLTLPFSGNPLAYGAIIFILGLLGAGFAAMSARQSIPGLISELQGLVDAGISDAELNSALEDLENIDGLGFFSNDRANAMRLLDNYNEMTDQALGSMRQLDELQGVVDELQAAGVSSPELEAEIAEIESMLNSQVEGDTNKDFSANLFESFRKNKEGS